MPVSERGATRFADAPSAFAELVNKVPTDGEFQRLTDPDVERALRAERKVRGEAFKEFARQQRNARAAQTAEDFGRRLIHDLGSIPVAREAPIFKIARGLDLGLQIYDLWKRGEAMELPGMPVSIPGSGLQPGDPFDPTDYGWVWFGAGDANLTSDPYNLTGSSYPPAVVSGVFDDPNVTYSTMTESNPFGLAGANWSNHVAKMFEYVEFGSDFFRPTPPYYSSGNRYGWTAGAVDPFAASGPAVTSFAPAVAFPNTQFSPNLRRHFESDNGERQEEQFREEMELRHQRASLPLELRAPSKWAIGVTLSPGTKVSPVREPISPRKPPADRSEKHKKSMTWAKKLGIALFHALDVVSESAEIVDSLFDALPSNIKRAYKRANKRPQTLGIDAAGQYGWDGADWKMRAIWDHAEDIDPETAVENIIKNAIQDLIIGGSQRLRPNNSVSAFQQSDLPLAKALNDVLDDLVRFRTDATHLEQWRVVRTTTPLTRNPLK